MPNISRGALLLFAAGVVGLVGALAGLLGWEPLAHSTEAIVDAPAIREKRVESLAWDRGEPAPLVQPVVVKTTPEVPTQMFIGECANGTQDFRPTLTPPAVVRSLGTVTAGAQILQQDPPPMDRNAVGVK